MFYFITVILRVWVYALWQIQMVCDVLRKKRDNFLYISDLNVAYNAAGLIVLDKNPELLINSAYPWYHCITLQTQVFFAFPHLADFNLEHLYHFVNRLDAPTSGLICLAYTKKACGIAARAFQKRTVSKRYLAIVWGHVGDDCLTEAPNYDVRAKYGLTKECDHETPIPEDLRPVCRKIGDYQYHVELAIGDFKITWPSGRSQSVMAPSYINGCYRPRPSSTKVTVLKHGYLNGKPASYLLLEPMTGRRHQLRLHTAVGLGGHPIAGDVLYANLFAASGNKEDNNEVYHDLSRMMLHACSLDIDLIPKQPFVKGKKKQERINNSHPEPCSVRLRSSRNILANSNGTWEDETVFRSMELFDL